MIRRQHVVAALVAVALATAASAAAAPYVVGPPAGIHDALALGALSGPPQYVSGGAARIRVTVPASVALTAATVTLNGADVTSAFAPDDRADHALEGVLTGLPLGSSTVEATVPGPGSSANDRASLTLTNYPITGPMFAGPKQPDFSCSTPGALAGFDLTGPFLDMNCSLPTRVDYYYRSTANTWKPFNAGAPRPADISQTTTSTGDTVDFVIRWERGTIDRFIYSIAVLDPEQTKLSAWNGKAIYYFGGGVAIGHYQGSNNQNESRYPYGLGKGYAILWSTGTKTNTHYNLVLGGETALMVKARFVTEYDDPIYTIGLGGSGGGIQQYVYGQDEPGLLDGGIPQYSYPDMVTQTIHIGDCELLEHWMDLQVLANPTSKWRVWSNRSWLEGLSSSNTIVNPYQPLTPWLAAPGSTECINGWRGLSPLVLNPHFGTVPGITPAQQVGVEWTHWNDAVNVYGRDPVTGFARSTWDNVGVQYGLHALLDHHLTATEFLDLNAQIGGWKPPQEMVQEGCPYVATACYADIDVWSARNMNPVGPNGVAARTEGSIGAMNGAYEKGLVFDGKSEIPYIDWRNYLDESLNMHNARQSFAARLRMREHDGDSSNQAIWFTDGRPAALFDQTPMALGVMDQWLANIRAHPELGVAGNKPADAVDSCFATNGSLIYRGADAWNGIIDSASPGPCTQVFPIHGTARTVAGAPFDEELYKCKLQPVEAAIDRGVYGWWHPTDAEIARLNEIFPSGVCDFSKGDQGRPPGFH